tara:strand:- start:1683 stop:2081 length:399 start_codon:yes stop_codon:yes gene_type:complete
MKNQLIFLYDGGCPLCRRETNFLKGRDKIGKIKFVDINNQEYDPKVYQNISFATAMSNLHGILKNGKIIKGLDVLAYSYQLIGLGWIYYPVKIPILSTFLKIIYKYWAKYRLQITGRNKLEILCDSQCKELS